ncbi:maleylpyruvate isomerase family mycothiol-dependent enzyme [Nonomuraea sp. NPDC050404]|uniref:maleylpyruvate isomerase family mycothiol-dependent enzyme n=1 Tax=Nonomuraea sp. NPDC050404 TaxID=3155783 RepID=UPI003408CC42
MSALHAARLVEALREQTAGFSRAVAGGDPEAKVPTCPEWRLSELVGHIGQAHRWAAGLVRLKGAPLPVPDPREAVPGEPGAWEEWLRAGAEELIAAVGEAEEGSQVWSVVGPMPPVFWLRRMFCDTAVHHYDAAATTGAAYEISGDLAAEVLTEGMQIVATPEAAAFLPRLAELRGGGERLGVRPDGMAGWLVTRTPEGPRWERGRSDGDVVVSGPVDECMLVFARRIPPRDVSGDRALLDHWLAHTAF